MATTQDGDELRALYLATFPQEERALVADLSAALLCEQEPLPALSLLAEAGGRVVGHVAFSPVTFAESGDPVGHILAPLAVLPDQQGQGLGTRLVEAGLQRLAGSGTILVYGDPAYYGRFGFSAKAAKAYLPPYPLQFPDGWQALVPGGSDFPSEPIEIRCVEPLCNPELW